MQELTSNLKKSLIATSALSFPSSSPPPAFMALSTLAYPTISELLVYLCNFRTRVEFSFVDSSIHNKESTINR